MFAIQAIEDFLQYLKEHLGTKEAVRPRKKRTVAPKKTTVPKKQAKKAVSKNDAGVDIFQIPDDLIVNDDGTVAMVTEEANKVATEEVLQVFTCNRIASASTLVGLQVTCQVALRLSEFLINSCGYLFVMLTRINQDNLEVGSKTFMYPEIYFQNAHQFTIQFCISEIFWYGQKFRRM
jgi:hypothetical protein